MSIYQLTMLVTILVNNFNYSKYIKCAIDSALSQTYSDIEVIVVDDGSTDGSQEIIKSYGNTIISVFKNNGGQASAFNAGFAKSKGEIICFLDSDDFFTPEKVKKIVKYFQDYPGIGWIFHELSYVDKLGKKLPLERSSQIDIERVVDFRETLIKGKRFSYSLPCGLCFKRNIIEKILPMPEAENVTLSDNYIKYAALALSPGLLSTNKLAVQRIHDNNTYTFRQDIEKLRAEINIKTGFYLRRNFPCIALFADKFFAKGVGEIFTELIFGTSFKIPEIKMYFENYFSWNFNFILFFLMRTIYHFLNSLLIKLRLIFLNKLNFQF